MSNETKKYELVKSESIVYNGRTLYRIKALRDFNTVTGETVFKGDLGGFIETENNLSQEGYCWIFNNAKVYDDARVSEDAKICGGAEIFDSAEVFGNAEISGNTQIFYGAHVCGNAKVYDSALVDDNALICDNARIYGLAKIFNKAIVYGNAKVYGNAQICGAAEVSNNAIIYGCAVVTGKAQIYNNAQVHGVAGICGKAKICDYAQIYDRACVFDEAEVCGSSLVCNVAEIGKNKKIKNGKYIFKSLNVDETLSKIEPICYKISFAVRVIELKLPIEQGYIESLVSQFAEYNELADSLCGRTYLFPKEKEILAMLSQCKEDVKILKKVK